MKTWMWISLCAIIVVLGIGICLTVNTKQQAKITILNDSIAELDSTAKAERSLAVKNDGVATSAQADLVSCQGDNENLNDSINNLAVVLAEMDTTLMETKAALAVATTKPGKKTKTSKTLPSVVADSTATAQKVPSGITGKSKPR